MNYRLQDIVTMKDASFFVASLSAKHFGTDFLELFFFHIKYTLEVLMHSAIKVSFLFLNNFFFINLVLDSLKTFFHLETFFFLLFSEIFKFHFVILKAEKKVILYLKKLIECKSFVKILRRATSLLCLLLKMCIRKLLCQCPQNTYQKKKSVERKPKILLFLFLLLFNITK